MVNLLAHFVAEFFRNCVVLSVKFVMMVNFLADPLRTPLNWRTRLQVAIDVAAALVL